MPYKDPEQERLYRVSPARRADTARRATRFGRYARALRRMIRGMGPSRYEELRASLTAEEAELLHSFAFGVPNG